MNNNNITVEFVPADQLDAKAWNAAVIASSGNPTQLAEFGSLGGTTRKPVFAQVWRDDKVVLRWLFYRAGPPGLVFLDIRSEPTSDDASLMQAVLDEAIARFRPFRISFYDMVYSRWQSQEGLKSLGFEDVQRYGTVVVDLKLGPETLRANMHKKQRSSFNRGGRDGLVLNEQSDAAGVERLYPIIAQTLDRGDAEMPPNKDYILAHANTLCTAGYGRLFFATLDGKDMGAAFEFVTPKLALGWLGGTRDDAPGSTGNFLQWSIIELLSQEGVAAYDLGGADILAEEGSKGHRLLKSKLRYGGELTEHCGAVQTPGRLRALVYDTLMRIRQKF